MRISRFAFWTIVLALLILTLAGGQRLYAGGSGSLAVPPASLSISTTSPLPNGTVNTSYPPQTLVATGGTAPYNWSLQAGTTLPAGLSLSGAGVISGTPTATGPSSFTVLVADSATQPASAMKTFTLTINPAPLSITTASPLPDATVNSPYSQTLTAVGGTTPYTWSLQPGNLPTSLNVSAAGVISGTPIAAGSFNFTVTVTDSGTHTAMATFALMIIPQLAITTTSPLSSGTVNVPYSQTLVGVRGTPPYTWSLQSGTTLPPGLSLSGAGVISGTPSAVGTSNFTVKLADSATHTTTAAFALTVTPPLSITTASPLPSGIANSPYSQTLAATGGAAPYTWSLQSGTLPTGLNLSSAGVISGTPSAGGTSTFTVKAADSGTQTATATFALTIIPQLTVTTSSPLHSGLVGASYLQSLVATGGTAPYTWSQTSGQLPPGLTLSAAGEITGTSIAAGTFAVTTKVTDGGSPAQSVTKVFVIQIADVLTVVASALPSGVVGVSYQQSLTASGGSSPYSWFLVSGSLPTGMSLTSTGVLSGTPSSAGTFSFVARVFDSGNPPQVATQSFAVVFTNPLSIINPTNLNNGSVGTVYSVAMLASGGTPAYSWALTTGQLPPGLTLSTTGIISGTPTTTGTFNFTLQVTDSLAAVSSQAFVITVQTGLTITTAALLPNALANSPYSQQLQASIATGPLNWSVVSGNLPSGITLSSGGLLSGTSSSLGVFNFTIQVTNGGTQQQVAAQSFKLQVVSALAITSSSTLPNGTLSVFYTTTLAATGGVGPYTWTLTAGTLPDGLNFSAAGLVSGTPSRAGAFTFTVQAADTTSLTTTGVFTISVAAPSIGSLSLVNIPATTNPTQQIPIALSLSAPQSSALSGSLTMTFTSTSVIPSDDPAVQFSTGSRTVNFTIPANATAAVFPTSVSLLTGTVSGTIVLTADIQGGPQGVAVGTITVPRTAPQLTNIVATRTAGGLTIQVTGYSPERKIINANFVFNIQTASGTQQMTLTRSVEADFDAWYTNTASSAFGSSFVFQQQFVVQGDTSTIQSVTITLTNGQGSTSSSPVAFTGP